MLIRRRDGELFRVDCFTFDSQMEEGEAHTLAITNEERHWRRNVCNPSGQRMWQVLVVFSAPRTHRDKERFPVTTISHSSIQMVEKMSENSNKAKIIIKPRAKDFGTEEHLGVGKQGAR